MASHFHLFPDRCWKFKKKRKKKERKKERKKEKKRKVKKRNEKKRKEKKSERKKSKKICSYILHISHTHKYGSTALVTHKHTCTVNDNLILYWSTVLQELGFFTEGILYMVKTVH